MNSGTSFDSLRPRCLGSKLLFWMHNRVKCVLPTPAFSDGVHQGKPWGSSLTSWVLSVGPLLLLTSLESTHEFSHFCD